MDICDFLRVLDSANKNTLPFFCGGNPWFTWFRYRTVFTVSTKFKLRHFHILGHKHGCKAHVTFGSWCENAQLCQQNPRRFIFDSANSSKLSNKRHRAKQSLSEAQRPSARDRPESSRNLAGFRETCSEYGSSLWKRELRSDLGPSGELLMARSAECSDGLQSHV